MLTASILGGWLGKEGEEEGALTAHTAFSPYSKKIQSNTLRPIHTHIHTYVYFCVIINLLFSCEIYLAWFVHAR